MNVWDVKNGRHVFHMKVNRERIIGIMFHAPTGRLGVATEFLLKSFVPETWEEESSYRYPVSPINVIAQHASNVVAIGGDHGVALCEAMW